MVVKCFTCGKQDSMLCFPCFAGGDHRGHKFYFLPGEGFCDCGLSEYMHESGNCRAHRESPFDSELPQMQQHPRLKADLAALMAAILKYSIRAPAVSERLHRDVLRAWNYLFGQILGRAQSNRNVLLLVLDTLINKHLLRELPEGILAELTAPVSARLEDEHAAVKSNLEIMFPDEKEGTGIFVGFGLGLFRRGDLNRVSCAVGGPASLRHVCNFAQNYIFGMPLGPGPGVSWNAP